MGEVKIKTCNFFVCVPHYIAMPFSCFYLFLVILQWPTKCVLFKNISLSLLLNTSKYLGIAIFSVSRHLANLYKFISFINYSF